MVPQTRPAARSYQDHKPYWDPSYARTFAGILKLVQIGASFLAFLSCVAVGVNIEPKDAFFEFVAVTSLIWTSMLLLLYLFHVIEYLFKTPWYLVEFIHCFLWTVLFLTGSACMTYLAVIFNTEGATKGWAAAAFFGYLAMVVYAIDAFCKFQDWRSGKQPQIITSAANRAKTISVIT